MFLSFNGGKDCTVLLDLIVNRLSESDRSQLQCWYIEPESDPSLDEVEEFVLSCEIYYKIKINRIKGRIKDALNIICTANPGLKACIMGSRRTDPYCEKLDSFQKTDPGWVDLMRVNPILVSNFKCFEAAILYVLISSLFQDWSCDNIWDYILGEKVPYCSLYDIGFTSLGHRNNTLPNPHLSYLNPDTNQVEYHPAYTLRNSDHLERAGRSK